MGLFGRAGDLPRSGRGGVLGVLVPIALLAALLIVVLRAAPEPSPRPSPAARITFQASFERLPTAPGGHYELWVERPDGGSAHLASFVVSVGGAILSLAGEPIPAFPVEDLPPTDSRILLTVEPGSETARDRSERVLMAGTLSTTEVKLDAVLPERTGKPVALLTVPTDAKAPDTTGLWFARPAEKGKYAAGLPVRQLGNGWAYGGFVTTGGGTMLRTGLFTDPQAADRAAPFSSTGRGLPFPGEDFVKDPPEGVSFPLNLADGRTTVTVSLLPDFAADAGEPFLPLLTARIPYQQKAGQPFPLEPVSEEQLPSGRGTFERSSQ